VPPLFCTFGKIFEQGVAAIKNIYLWLHFLGCTLWPFITLIKNKLINNNLALIVLMRNFLYKSMAIILLILAFGHKLPIKIMLLPKPRILLTRYQLPTQ
jgi:hypothetical protein